MVELEHGITELLLAVQLHRRHALTLTTLHRELHTKKHLVSPGEHREAVEQPGSPGFFETPVVRPFVAVVQFGPGRLVGWGVA